MNQLKANNFFSELNQSQLLLLEQYADVIELPKGAQFINEGDYDKCFYYLLEGEVTIYKTVNYRHHNIAIIKPGDVIGELALLDDKPRSASANCLTNVKLYRFSIETLKIQPELYTNILKKMAHQLSERLRYTNEVTVASLESKITIGIFSLKLVSLLAIYTLFLNVIKATEKFFSSTTAISIFIILVFTAVLLSNMKKSGYPMAFYGLNKNDWIKKSVNAIYLTIPFMLLIVLLKYLVITFIPSLQHISLFDPSAPFKKGMEFNFNTYFLMMFGYAVFCPIQEFIVRGGIQTTLETFFEKNQDHATGIAILVSNLLFASTHSHTSLGFAFSAFFPGLFWGWLYAKQRSLIGVSISHIILGIWAAFIVGFQNII